MTDEGSKKQQLSFFIPHPSSLVFERTIAPMPTPWPDPLSTRSAQEVLARRIRVARGHEPGDLLLTGGQVVNVFTKRVESANVVIADGWTAGVGAHTWRAHSIVSIAGAFVLPGFIDSHMHLESTLLNPAELSRLLLLLSSQRIVNAGDKAQTIPKLTAQSLLPGMKRRQFPPLLRTFRFQRLPAHNVPPRLRAEDWSSPRTEK